MENLAAKNEFLKIKSREDQLKKIQDAIYSV